MKYVEALLCHGAEVDVKKDINGKTLLALARQNGHEFIVNIRKEHMKAQQKRKVVDYADNTNDISSTDSISSQNISSTSEETNEASCNDVTTSTASPHNLEPEKKNSKKMIHNEGNALQKKLQVLEDKYAHQEESEVISLEKKIQVLLEAQKASQCSATEELTSSLAKIQEVLEKHLTNQQALVKENMSLLEQKLHSTIQETLKMQVSEAEKCVQGGASNEEEVATDALKRMIQVLEQQVTNQQALVKEKIVLLEQKIDLKDQEFKTCSQCTGTTLEATTNALKKKIEVLEKQVNDTHSQAEEKIQTAVEQKLDSKIQDAMEQQYEYLSRSSFKRKAADDDDIEGPAKSSKRLKATYGEHEKASKMMSLEKGVVTIQQSIEKMERKSFRKNIILIGLCGALSLVSGSY